MHLSMPSEAHSLNPKAEDPSLRERSLILALRQGCHVLVQDGLDWSRLPTLRPKLWEEGVQLRRLLVEAPGAGLRDLV